MGRCRFYRLKNHCRHSLLVVLAALMFVVPLLRGQSVEINPTISSAVAPLPADDSPTGNGLITSQFGENKGPFEYALHLSIRGAYDDNIALTHMHRLDDWFVLVQPSLMLGVGDIAKHERFLMANYLPNIYRYDDHPEFDSYQHDIRLL